MVIGHAFLKMKTIEQYRYLVFFYLIYCWPITFNIWNVFIQLVFCVFLYQYYSKVEFCHVVQEVTRLLIWIKQVALFQHCSHEQQKLIIRQCIIKFNIFWHISTVDLAHKSVNFYRHIFMINTNTLLLFLFSNCGKIFLNVFAQVVF